jgi:hypothetical protein
VISLRIAAQKENFIKLKKLTILEAIDMCKIIHGSKVAKNLKSFQVSKESTY